MKRRLLLLLPLLVWGLLATRTAKAQTNIEPQLLYADTVAYPFTSEWQYLSTDIFLFNPDKFAKVINEMDFYEYTQGKKKKRRKHKPEEWIEYLFITATLRNVRFFGDAEMTYPLYHFQVMNDPKTGYQTHASDNIDHVRVLDNLPLASASDNIDAEIRVHAITGNNGDMIMQMVASQLKNIAKITTPIGAVMSLVGEFGNLLDANSQKREYRFSSTIRLFEQRNFDRRLHSIKIYELRTAQSEAHRVDIAPIRTFLDTVGLGIQSRAAVRRILPAREYPLIVVFNYKSQYRVQPLSGDEVTFANIEKRKLKVENDYRQNIITPDTYRQERDFATFLTVFATFKNHLEVYKLNYRSGNTDAIAGSLFTLMQHYRGLVASFNEMQYKYKGNRTFTSLFAPEYRRIIGFAEQYLGDDYNLRSVRNLVQTLASVTESPQVYDAVELENIIARLRFSDHFKTEMMQSLPEGELIRKQLGHLEQDLYYRVFVPQIESLDAMKVTLEMRGAPQALQRAARASKCRLCRDSVNRAVERFQAKIEVLELREALAEHDSLANCYAPWIYNQVALCQQVRRNYDSLYGQDTVNQSTVYLRTQLEQAEQNLAHLREFVVMDARGRNLDAVRTLNERLQVYHARVEESLAALKKMSPALFDEEKVGEEKREKEGEETDTAVVGKSSKLQGAGL